MVICFSDNFFLRLCGETVEDSCEEASIRDVMRREISEGSSREKEAGGGKPWGAM